MNSNTCLVFASIFVGIVTGASGFDNELEQKLRVVEQRLHRAEERFKLINKTFGEDLEKMKTSRRYSFQNIEIVDQMANKCDRGRSHWRCMESGECIHELSACDGHVDCADGSDERDDVCDDSIYAPGLVYRAYLSKDQECFSDTKKVLVEYIADKVTRLPHFPQVVFILGRLSWQYKRVDGSETFESRDFYGTYMLGSKFERVWTIKDDPPIFMTTYMPRFVKETPMISYFYLDEDAQPCGWCAWTIPGGFDEKKDAVYSDHKQYLHIIP